MYHSRSQTACQRVCGSYPSASAQHSSEHGMQVQVVGNWMSKIEGLLRCIVRLRQVAPEEKSLVFSQYPDALKLVGKALNVNNIDWVELRGGAKVSNHHFWPCMGATAASASVMQHHLVSQVRLWASLSVLQCIPFHGLPACMAAILPSMLHTGIIITSM